MLNKRVVILNKPLALSNETSVIGERLFGSTSQLIDGPTIQSELPLINHRKSWSARPVSSHFAKTSIHLQRSRWAGKGGDWKIAPPSPSYICLLSAAAACPCRSHYWCHLRSKRINLHLRRSLLILISCRDHFHHRLGMFDSSSSRSARATCFPPTSHPSHTPFGMRTVSSVSAQR